MATEALTEEEYMRSGHMGCPGCGLASTIRLVMKVLEPFVHADNSEDLPTVDQFARAGITIHILDDVEVLGILKPRH